MDNLRAAARYWTVELEEPVHQSPTGYLGKGVQRGRPVAIKVASSSDEALGGLALEHFGGRGCVRLFDRWNGASLLERAVPGVSASELSRHGKDDEAIAQIARVATALHQAGPPHPSAGFPTVGQWGEGFHRYRAAGARVLPPELVTAAETTFAELERTQGQVCLLHGDLHHFNLVLDAARGWLAIDPKGVIGEPAFEFGAALRNPRGKGFPLSTYTSPEVIDRRLRIIAETTGLDRDRIMRWAFAQSVLSVIWSWEDGEEVEEGVELAGAFRRIQDNEVR